MTAAVHDRAARKRAPKIAWMRFPDQALGLLLGAGVVISGVVFVVLSF